MRKHLGSGILAGMVGGVVGSIALRAWMTAMSYRHKGTPVPDSDGPAHRVADLMVKKTIGAALSRQQRLVGGEIVHYAFGAFTGAIYGGLAEFAPWTTAGRGLLFGTGVFLAADESSMPLLGLIPPPWTETPAAQLEHLAAHLVYGAVSEYSRRRLRDVL